jgi:hypothetical protein
MHDKGVVMQNELGPFDCFIAIINETQEAISNHLLHPKSRKYLRELHTIFFENEAGLDLVLSDKPLKEIYHAKRPFKKASQRSTQGTKAKRTKARSGKVC